MTIVESIYLNMAMANINVAIDRLHELLDKNKFPADSRDIKWAGLGCSYSRCIHKNVWRDNVSKERVLSEIIPLLGLAEKQVGELLAISNIDESDKEEISRYSENIRLRLGNLKHNYLNDVASCFPANVMEPRLANNDSRSF